MSRLEFAPKLKEIEIVDIKKGLGLFKPKPGRQVSFAALKEALKKAGYTLASAEITVAGTLAREGKNWRVVAEGTGQHFALEGTDVGRLLTGAEEGSRVEAAGDWQTVGEKTNARERLAPRLLKKTGGAEETKPAARAREKSLTAGAYFVGAHFVGGLFESETHFDAPAATKSAPPMAKPAAPIRTTSPGLTVYKGGAVTPRLYFVKQHAGGLDVRRQVLDLSVSYTPTPRLQLEAEAPLARTSFDDGEMEGSGFGLGNVTLWAKYRFYRSVKTYGDRQASARVGLELPTGKKDAPTSAQAGVPDFVRQQLTPISGGFAPHFDVAFSQAGGRLIFGGNVEGVVRAERAGFRTGHELRANTDVEYVLLPRRYDTPGGELFVILETNFVWRGRGRMGGAVVDDSKATEFYLSPGLQYAARPRLVFEGSLQLPVVRHTGAQLLKTDYNLLLGMKYLF
ncbi:MAG TPA: transporter [Pyrinomonadaceae bacterium]